MMSNEIIPADLLAKAFEPIAREWTIAIWGFLLAICISWIIAETVVSVIGYFLIKKPTHNKKGHP